MSDSLFIMLVGLAGSGKSTYAEQRQKEIDGCIILSSDKIREELADVLNYCILMADVCGLDMDEIVQEKIKRNNAKYPVEKAKDSAKKYDEL